MVLENLIISVLILILVLLGDTAWKSGGHFIDQFKNRLGESKQDRILKMVEQLLTVQEKMMIHLLLDVSTETVEVVLEEESPQPPPPPQEEGSSQ